MTREPMTEADQILEFRYRRTTWKQIAIFIAVSVISYVFFVGLATIFGWN